MAQEVGQVAHGSIRAWHLGRGARNTDMANRVDPRHLSHMGRLVRWFDEDVNSLRVGGCETRAQWARWARPNASTVAISYCSTWNTIAANV
jgi:hypothetical protein